MILTLLFLFIWKIKNDLKIDMERKQNFYRKERSWYYNNLNNVYLLRRKYHSILVSRIIIYSMNFLIYLFYNSSLLILLLFNLNCPNSILSIAIKYPSFRNFSNLFLILKFVFWFGSNSHSPHTVSFYLHYDSNAIFQFDTKLYRFSKPITIK